MEGSLPHGWTEHRAPSGIPYYWNAELKKSTYKRPTWPDEREKALNIAHVNQEEKVDAQKSIRDQSTEEKRKSDREVRKQSFDRPKYKKSIPGSDVWVVVTTKRSRYFFYNTKTHESSWLPPQELMAVISTLRLPKRKLKSKFRSSASGVSTSDGNDNGIVSGDRLDEHSESLREETSPSEHEEEEEEEEEERVEEEVVESEDEEDDQDLSENDENENIEFGEEDFLFQLQEMEGINQDGDLQEKEEPVIDHETAVQTFKQLLEDKRVDVYQTWEFTYPKLVDDERFRILDSGQDRRQVFEDYCKSAIASKPDRPSKASSLSGFWNLLQNLPNNILWPEFKRKYRKSPVLNIPRFSDRDLEKLFREFQILRNRSMEERIHNFESLCRSKKIDPKRPDTYNDKILNDVRYAVINPEELRSWLVNN
ncbi:DNA replication protein Dre4 [Schizosaccharomyces octosporus yFS286]|uniref:DNA replication protein Dre4 n=1 Tax=Schizosaccharomyces octosporus (strain yFS286) TaxID=483514 RepID=S9Q4F0_SCHOY|nr:DNA replication protein Dre4 [Schizosaccharomyces octosporus yFS286]EPX74962.1 DNA replication protein Dre4 [Schizosaccharomyces octosporus yFS286]